MEKILADLREIPGILGSFIISEEGIPVASDFSSALDEEEVAAVVSSVIKTSQQCMDRLRRGNLQTLLVETERTRLLAAKARAGFLVIVTQMQANLGLMRLEVKSALKKMEMKMESSG